MRRLLSDPDRRDFDGSLTVADVRELAAARELQVLQTVAPVPDKTWRLLNDHLLPVRPDVELRAYGHYGQRCDLRFLRHIPNVRHFTADCLRDADHLEEIGELPSLERLSIGIYNADDFGFLRGVPARLRSLFLGATRSKKPDLAPLEHLGELTTLSLQGQRKNIEVLSQLCSLEDVTLREITTPDLSYLRPLDKLRSLDIKLGGIRHLGAIDCLHGLEYLEVWQVRGLSDLSVISQLAGLQDLFLQSLPHVKSLPSLRNNRSLRRIYMLNLSGLKDLRALEAAPALERVSVAQARQLTPDDFLPVLRNPTVRFVSAGLGSRRKNDAFARLRDLHGKRDTQSAPTFEYT